MKRALVLLSFVLLSFGSLAALAEDAPETIVIPNKKGNVTLPHKTHGQMTACSTCHGETVGKFLPMGMSKGHATCKNCHQQNGGPTGCAECHKK